MKRTTSILLLLLFAYNIAGLYVTFKVLQMEAKEEAVRQIAANLPEEDLDVIVIDSSALNDGSSKIIWKEEGKEFRFEDKLYDVVRIKYSNGKAHLICLNDVNEENIIQNFSNFIHKKTDNNNKWNNLLSKIPSYYFQEIRYNLTELDSNPFRLEEISSYKNFTAKIDTPPPRIS